MTGLLRSKGICVSEGKVRQSLKRLDPVSHQIRHETAVRLINPKCYNADYFGHKVHMDQNEKLKMFGVTRNGTGWLFWNDCGILYDAC